MGATSGKRNGFADPGPLHGATDPGPFHGAETSPATPPADSSRPNLHSGTGLTELHESIASLLASRGQWRQAYHHLRSALDLMSPRKDEVNRLRRENAEAREQSMRDSLTASYNRRYLDERLTDLLAEHAGTDHGLAIALVDLDWFKQVNDTHGHLLGDRVLQLVVKLLQQSLPAGAFCARFGGEEFVLVMPGTDLESAVQVCECARRRVDQFPWSKITPGLHVTISVGVAHERAIPAPASAEKQLVSADALLYAAKEAGRNQVAYRHGRRIRLTGLEDTRPVDAPQRAAGY